MNNKSCAEVFKFGRGIKTENRQEYSNGIEFKLLDLSLRTVYIRV